MSSRRPQIEVFGASLLDMMMCGFGAVLLLFIIQRTASGGKAHEIEQQIAVTDAVADRFPEPDEEAVDATAEVRARSPGPRALGVPVISGPVVFVLDASESMISHGLAKRDTALRLLEQVIASPHGPSTVAVIVFDSRPRVVMPWTPISGDRATRASEMRLEIEHAFSVGANTNLAGALEVAVTLLGERVTHGTIVVFSDGLHHLPNEPPLGADELVTRITRVADGQGFPTAMPTIHAIGLFDWPARPMGVDDLGDPSNLHRFRAALQRRTDAYRWAGASSGAFADGVRPEDLVGATPGDLEFHRSPAGSVGLSEVERFLRGTADLALGDGLFRLSNAFGGRFVGISIDPFPEP